MDDNGRKKIASEKLVFIFKALKENAHDKYEKILGHNGIPFAAIPVLSFEFVNRDALISNLSQPDRFSAIILTSARAVEAVVYALQDLSHDTKYSVATLQCFVVGPATYDAALVAGFKPEGKDTGNAKTLAEFILRTVKDSSKPLLFPCSNIRKDSIPDILQSKGLKITEIVAYETSPYGHIGEHLKKAIDDKGFPEYTVFFSPSGFKSVHAIETEYSFPLEETKIIALGPSTASVVTKEGFNLHGTTERPDPESLLYLLQESMSKES